MTDTDPVQVEENQEEDPLSYADHMDKCEAFADELNGILRARGFHICEAMVVQTWQGQLILVKNTMTNGMGPQGPVQLVGQFPIPLPWRLPPAAQVEPGDALTQALTILDKGAIDQCAKQKVLALSYNGFVKRMSTSIATASAQPAPNGRPRILRA